MADVERDDNGDEGPIEPGRLVLPADVDGEDPLVPEPLRIQDLQQYRQVHGLQDRIVGSLSEQNMTEARQRVQEASAYQETVHKKFFQEEEEANPDRRGYLDSILQIETIDIPTSTDIIRDIPLKAMAKACDTILTFCSFRQTQQREKETRLSFALDSFQHESVVEFVGLVLGNRNSEEISPDCVVDCCEIARFMQCSTVLDQMVEILMRSIDNTNCMSLCQLADRLDLPRLFEQSMARAMGSLGDLQYLEVWKDFNPELKCRIVTMERLMKSSILNNGSRLYFASLDEYLAIFSENVQYYRERLEAAKERQSEAVSKGNGWKDAQKKICMQEKRLLTLETVLKEQKKVFSVKGDVCHIRASY